MIAFHHHTRPALLFFFSHTLSEAKNAASPCVLILVPWRDFQTVLPRFDGYTHVLNPCYPTRPLSNKKSYKKKNKKKERNTTLIILKIDHSSLLFFFFFAPARNSRHFDLLGLSIPFFGANRDNKKNNTQKLKTEKYQENKKRMIETGKSSDTPQAGVMSSNIEEQRAVNWVPISRQFVTASCF